MRSRSRFFAAIVLVAVFAIPLPLFLGAVERADVLFVARDEVRDEDVYALANRVIIEGTIEGDLVALAGDVTVTGTGIVTGDVTALTAGTVRIDGTVGGSVRAAAIDIRMNGTVDEDFFMFGLDLQVGGRIGRDLLLTGGSLDVDGEVGRDLLGQVLAADLDGAVGHDVDIMVQSFTVGATAAVDGDLTYRAPGDARVSAGATIGGQFARLDLQFPFVIAVILRVANIVGFLGFLLLGLLAFWLFRNTTPRGTAMVGLRPLATFLVGIAVLLGLPLLTVLLGLTLVGIPAALIVLLAFLIALVAGPVPAVTAFGDRMLRGRGGILGAFLAGAIVWRAAIWLIPWIGFALYLVALTWGLGGWAIGAWELRAERISAGTVALMTPEPEERPAPRRETAGESWGGWEPPLPPEPEAGPDDEADAEDQTDDTVEES